ncbi:MAG: ABC transporter substrate-binding protein [Anaerolineae bacterium]|nr:ABC transporter substrate-binding protein [Anaerolineae bacterium]
MKKLLLLTVVALILGMALPFTATAQQANMLRIPISADPEHLDPFRSTTTNTRAVIINTYEGLTTFDPETATVIPALADSWDISEDGLVYTFHLKEGVLFQDVASVTYDDRAVTAADWVWSMEMFLSGDEAISTHADYLEAILGAPEFTAGEADSVAGINVIDDYTLEITLAGPSHRFLYDLINVYVVPQEAYEQLGENFSNTPVGTGPFIFSEWLRDDHITMLANPEYWEAGYPLVEELRFLNIPDDTNAALMYREGEVDVLTSFPTGQRTLLAEEFAADYVELPSLNVRYFGFDMSQGFFAENPLVRQAFAHAFNRDLVWNDLMEGARFPANMGVLPPSMPAADVSAVYDYDLDAAAALLEEAGFPGGEGIPPIDLYVFASAADELSLPVLQADLAQLGVTLNIVVEDNSTYWGHIGEDDVIMFLSGWSADFSDPSEIFNFLFLDGRDDTHYDNPVVNEMIRAATAITDDAERNALYLEIHELIMQDCPWIVSAYGKVAFLAQPWLDGLYASPAGIYRTPWKYVSINAM